MKKPKFIIIATNRTGSTLTRRALDSHSQLEVEDELLRWQGCSSFDDFTKRYISELYPVEKIPKLGAHADVIPLINRIFADFNGFKLILGAGQLNLNNPVWIYLATQPDIFIIHLTRKDTLAQVISKIIADEIRVWHVEENAKVPELPTVHVNVDEVFRHMEAAWYNEQYIQHLFASSPHYTKIYYEQTLADPHHVFAYLQGFLQIPLERLRITTKKMITLPVAELIENYEEVVERLRPTRWRHLVQ